MASVQPRWFVRQGDVISGPFTPALIASNLVSGIFNPDDEISLDREVWLPISAHETAEVDLQSPAGDQPITDRRSGYDRRANTDDDADAPRAADRRQTQSSDTIARQQARTQLMQRYRQRYAQVKWPLLILALVVLLLVILAIQNPTSHPEPSDCQQPPGPGVNWQNCTLLHLHLAGASLEGARWRNAKLAGSELMNANLSQADLAYTDLSDSNLSYSNLQSAQLKGANLQRSDLRHSDLLNADLSFADLRQAQLGGARLEGARLDHALWIDGSRCAVGSVGQCLSEN